MTLLIAFIFGVVAFTIVAEHQHGPKKTKVTKPEVTFDTAWASIRSAQQWVDYSLRMVRSDPNKMG